MTCPRTPPGDWGISIGTRKRGERETGNVATQPTTQPTHLTECNRKRRTRLSYSWPSSPGLAFAAIHVLPRVLKHSVVPKHPPREVDRWRTGQPRPCPW
jgi:hypothetical protein